MPVDLDALNLGLAARAEMRGSPPEDDPLNLFVANTAGFPRAIVHFVAKLEPTRFAIRIAIIPQRAAPMIDRLAENSFDGAVQGCDLQVGQSVRRDEWVNPSGEERFIDIDIPQPRDQRLIEQRGFDRSACGGQLPLQSRDAHRKRFRPHSMIR